MNRICVQVLAFVVLLPFGLPGCKQAETTAPEHVQGEGPAGEFEGREVVDNWRAQTGDVTVCPITGKKFEVDANSPHFSYQGYKFVFCCCLEQAEADPGKYLDKLVEEAGGPASDPDRVDGGAIDDSASGKHDLM